MLEKRLLGIYLNHHLAGATGGLELIRRVANSHRGTDLGRQVVELVEESDSDREALRDIMRRLGISESAPQKALGWAAERAGRLKLNGHLFTRSPLSDVIEFEGLRLGVAAKTSSWHVLRAVAEHDARLDAAELEALIARAEDQMRRVISMHLQVTERNLAG